MKKILELIKEKQQLLNRPLIIGIDGRCGSGKTTLSNILKDCFNVEIIRIDHFFLQPHQRVEERLNEIGGNFDYERFILEVKDPLINKKDIYYQVFSCASMKLEEKIEVDKSKTIIIEGTYSCHPLIEDIYDIKIFVDIDSKEQINRIRNRDGEFFLNRFINEWIPKEEAYFTKFNIENKADIKLKL